MKLYLDLDGVLADFDQHFKDSFGYHPASVNDQILWKKINSYETFFLDLPLMPRALELFEYLTDYFDVTILTACPKSNYRKSALQKRAWVRKNISDEITILPVLGGKNKGLFMHDVGDLLIDDMEKNCAAWRELGGIAIQHRNVTTTIEKVRTLI